MPGEQYFTAYGLRFGLQVPVEAMLAQAAAHLPLGWLPAPPGQVDVQYRVCPEPTPGSRSMLYCDDTLLIGTSDLDQLWIVFANHAQLLTAFRAQNCLFVHAGVVGWPGQAGMRAILIPGRTLSGKTTLVRALVQAGATYYSDEFAVLDPAGRVHPYAVPLSIRQQRDQVGVKTPVEALGGQAGDAPLPVRLIVITRYQPRARWRPQPLSPGQALLALMDNTVAAQRDPALSMPILKQVVGQAQVISSRRGQAERIAPRLLRYLD